MPPAESIELAIRPLVASALAVDLALLAALVWIAVRYRARWRAPGLPDVPKRDAIVVALLTIGAAAIRIPLLSRAMGTDEAASFLYYASKPLMVGLTVYGSPNNHVLHTALMHGSWRLFGAEEWALRLPALIAGIALVPLAYLASRALAREGSLIAAALVAAMPVFVDYSTDGRGYTMLCAFTLVAILAAQRVARDGNTIAAIAFAIAVALGAYTVPAMLYPFAMLVAWRPRRLFAAAPLAGLFTLMLYLPTLMVSGFGAIAANPYVQPLPLAQFVASAPDAAAAVWRSWMTAVPVVLQIVLAIAFVAGVIRQRMSLWLGAIAIVAIVAVQRVHPFPRVWLPLAILFAITAAGAVPWKRFEPVIALVLFGGMAVLALTVPRLRETGALPHAREIAGLLVGRAGPGDGIHAPSPSDLPLAFYLGDRVLHPPRDARRIFVVVNRAYGPPLRVDERAFAVRLVRDFGDAAVYQLDRR